MFDRLFQPMHLLVIFGIALLVFGPKSFPELGKELSESIQRLQIGDERAGEPSDKITIPPCDSGPAITSGRSETRCLSV